MTLTKNEHGYWEVRIKDSSGAVRSFSTKKKNREEARKIIRDAKLEEIEQAAELRILQENVVSVLIAGRKTTVEDAVEPLVDSMRRSHHSERTVTEVEGWIRVWAEDMKLLRRPIHAITEADIDGWVNPKRGATTKAGTRRVMLSAIRTLFSFSNDKGWTRGNPARLVDVDYDQLLHSQKEVTKQPAFTDFEVEILIRRSGPDGLKPSPFWYAAVPMSRCLGLRLIDICCMEWDSVQPDGRIISWTKKRDKRVYPPVLRPDWLKTAIDSVPRGSSRYLFPLQRSIILDPAVRSTLSTQFSRLCKSLDIGGKSFHGLRATYVTEMMAAGTSIEEVSEAVGHSDTVTTEGYIRTSEG